MSSGLSSPASCVAGARARLTSCWSCWGSDLLLLLHTGRSLSPARSSPGAASHTCHDHHHHHITHIQCSPVRLSVSVLSVPVLPVAVVPVPVLVVALPLPLPGVAVVVVIPVVTVTGPVVLTVSLVTWLTVISDKQF